jgi:DHA3 family macrolide efflux protein-like MFS transporter
MLQYASFLWIWAGQVVSIFGSSLSGFALGVWLYQVTGSASNFALVALCTVLPQLLVSPLAGVLVDRYPRRWMMALGDSGAALCTLGMAALFFGGPALVQPWQVFLVTALSSAFGALQSPAYLALVPGMVPETQLGRANGLIQLGQGLAEVLAPALAGLLVATIGVPGVLLIDLGTFVVAVTVLALVRSPGGEPETAPRIVAHSHLASVHHSRTAGQRAGLHGLLDGWLAGWDALRAQPGLPGLLRFQMVFSFLWSLFGVLVSPMILGFADAPGLGLVLSAAGGGMLAGSLVMSAWGGPRRRLSGMLGFELASAAAFVLMGLRPSLALVAGAAFLAHVTLAFVSGLNQSIWQSRVAPVVLGRVLALRQAAIKSATLLAYLLAGGLADSVLEPLLLPGGGLASSLGVWIGVGPGRGIAALCLVIGLVKAGTVLAVYTNTPISTS